MIKPQLSMNLNPERELIVDLFAGGGGVSTGIERALGRYVDIAVNHNREAVAMHRMNHPQTRHYNESVFTVDPLTVTRGRKVGGLHASPDCTHFSNAASNKPKDKEVRGLAWVVIHWVNQVGPRLLTLENVVEFRKWGPLIRTEAHLAKLQKKYPKKKLKLNWPNPDREGWFFKCFIGALERRGYKVDHDALRACDFGSPTIRKRLFLMARNDGAPLVWPVETHAKVKAPNKKLYRTAAECIDHSIPVPSIFDRAKPYAEASNVRIAKGVMRLVVNHPDPYIVPGSELQVDFLTENANSSAARVWSMDEPLRTQCAAVKGGHFAKVSVFLTRYFGQSVGQHLSEPQPTTMASGGGKTGMVSAFLCKMRGDNVGHDLREPLHTISSGGLHHAACYAFLTKYYGAGDGVCALDEPLHTVTAKDRFGLVLVKVQGEDWVLTDIGYRMLQPHELFLAQGFPPEYIIDRGLFLDEAAGQFYEAPLKKVAQVRMCGNSVCPDVIEAIWRANLSDLSEWEEAA